ncbi:hypothetical protein Tco_1473540 [Tanacetum coccineum]
MSAPRRDRLPPTSRSPADGATGNDERDPRDVEIERLRERVRELENTQRSGRSKMDPKSSRWSCSLHRQTLSVRTGSTAEKTVTKLKLGDDEGLMQIMTVDLGLYVKNDFFNKIGLVDCGPQDQMGRKDYEGPTTTSLDVLKSLSSKIAKQMCWVLCYLSGLN